MIAPNRSVPRAPWKTAPWKTALAVMLMFGCKPSYVHSGTYKLADGTCVDFTEVEDQNGCKATVEPTRVNCGTLPGTPPVLTAPAPAGTPTAPAGTP
jgi:hypothetical protein